MGKCGEASEWWGPHGEISHVPECGDRKGVDSHQGQAEFPVQDPDPGYVVHHTAGQLKVTSHVGDVVA